MVVPSESGFPFPFDAGKGQFPVQFDTAILSSFVDTFVGGIRIAKHSTETKTTMDHMLGNTTNVLDGVVQSA